MAERACRVRVLGRVQGVFFRAWTMDQARELSVAGWVRNAGDGSVEAHVEGERGAVEKLIDRMRQGPPSAEVRDLHVHEASGEGLDRFEVRH